MINRLRRAPQAPVDHPLRAMFAARKDVFIDLLKWDLSILADAYEIDQFDDAHARYLILMDGGQHRASTRLLRTDRPHLLGALFPFLCDGPVPTGPTTREITRFCLDRNQTAASRRSARNQLVTGLAEFALREGITDYIGFADVNWFAQIERFGWRCGALGDPVCFGRDTLVALHIEIDGSTIDGLKATGTFARPTFNLIDEEWMGNDHVPSDDIAAVDPIPVLA